MFIDSEKAAKASRLSFGEELAALGEVNKDIVALDADLSKSTRTDLFAAKFPDRFFEMGIAEANMIGVAAGLANTGKIAFCASFGCFLTGRYDQIRMSVAFSGANVRLIGTHAGVGIGEDGHSQMALEDLTLMRSLPNMVVFQPGDDQDTREFMRWSLGHHGPCYMRLTRQNLPNLVRPGNYAFGIGKWFYAGGKMPKKDAVVVIATGGALKGAAMALERMMTLHPGQEFALVNAAWIQPYDEKILTEILHAQPKALVTVEDHYPVGGLGGLVAEFVAAQPNPARVFRFGVDGFGQSGTPEQTYRHYKLDAEGIQQRIQSVLDVLNS